jgi:hypothetical protein
VDRVRSALLGLALVLAAGGCGDDGGDHGGAEEATDSGCPVEPGQVGELLGYEVAVLEDTATAGACRYEPVDPGDADPDTDEPDRAGAHVLVVERRIAGETDEGDGYTAVRDAVEVDVGPTETLGEDVVPGGRGWIARVGRVVQVGVARDRRLVQVTVADPTLAADAADEVALDLALEALG